jgi:phenylalanyl-tRNA synthetase alpha chain
MSASKSLADLLAELERLQGQAAGLFDAVTGTADLEKIRVEWLGKKSPLSEIMKQVGALSPEDRPKVGARANEIRGALQNRLTELEERLKAQEISAKLASDKIDVSLAGRRPGTLNAHPVQIVQDELVEILRGCGFVVEVGPEVEHEFYNFDALNFPPNHPARALQDTFFIKGDAEGAGPVVLRTHTSPVQVRTMLAQKPPIRMICPGRVYRADYDATHSPMFHQIEALLVDKDVTMADLKGTLKEMISRFFGFELKVRLRPSFFPFTEPSAEVDIECHFCRGKGCKTCKNSGWIEIGGCGMVDPEVFKASGIDPETYQGFAFGMGLERMAMLKYDVSDLRTFFESDHRFVSQFARWRA